MSESQQDQIMRNIAMQMKATPYIDGLMRHLLQDAYSGFGSKEMLYQNRDWASGWYLVADDFLLIADTLVDQS